MESLLPREDWQILPYKWGLTRVLIGENEAGQEKSLVLPRSHPHDAPTPTAVQYKYCGGDSTRAHESTSLEPQTDYCPWLAGHGTITQADVDEVMEEDERLGEVLQRIVNGEIKDIIPVTVTHGAMRGHQTFPLTVLFLGDPAALVEAANEARVEEAAVRLLARGGTVAPPPVRL